jgi:N-ethylmaleimide reductase
MAPLTRNRAGADGVPMELVARYYAQRATAGLIVSEATQVVPEGAGEPGPPGIYTKSQARGWSSVTQQSTRRGDGSSSSSGTPEPRLRPSSCRRTCRRWRRAISRAPSDAGGRFDRSGGSPSRKSETWSRLTRKLRSARSALDSTGSRSTRRTAYLLEQFMRNETNRRTDRYGGSPSNKIRAILEIVDAVTNTWDPARVRVRVSPPAPWARRWDRDPATLFRMLARELSYREMGYLHVVRRGVRWPLGRTLDPRFFRRHFSGPLIVCGGFTPRRAETVLQRGDADLVAFGRLFVSNPDLPRRIASGASLQRWDEATFHTSGARGYLDYPTLSERPAGATTRDVEAPDRSPWRQP